MKKAVEEVKEKPIREKPSPVKTKPKIVTSEDEEDFALDDADFVAACGEELAPKEKSKSEEA